MRHVYFAFCVLIVLNPQVLIFRYHHFFQSIRRNQLILTVLDRKFSNLSIQILIFGVKNAFGVVDFSDGSIFEIKLLIICVIDFLQLIEDHQTVQPLSIDLILNQVDLGAQNFLEVSDMRRAIFFLRCRCLLIYHLGYLPLLQLLGGRRLFLVTLGNLHAQHSVIEFSHLLGFFYQGTLFLVLSFVFHDMFDYV